MPVALTAVVLLDDNIGGWSLMTSIFLFLQAGRVDVTHVPFLPCLPVNNSISPSRPPVPTCSTTTQDEHATPSPRAMPAGSLAAAWQMFTWHRWEPEMRREQQTSVKACVQQTHTHTHWDTATGAEYSCAEKPVRLRTEPYTALNTFTTNPQYLNFFRKETRLYGAYVSPLSPETPRNGLFMCLFVCLFVWVGSEGGMINENSFPPTASVSQDGWERRARCVTLMQGAVNYSWWTDCATECRPTAAILGRPLWGSQVRFTLQAYG